LHHENAAADDAGGLDLLMKDLLDGTPARQACASV
jgi:hypothetical protein